MENKMEGQNSNQVNESLRCHVDLYKYDVMNENKSKISKLKSRNKELKQALQKSYIALKQTEYGLSRLSIEAIESAEQALNKK